MKVQTSSCLRIWSSVVWGNDWTSFLLQNHSSQSPRAEVDLITSAHPSVYLGRGLWRFQNWYKEELILKVGFSCRKEVVSKVPLFSHPGTPFRLLLGSTKYNKSEGMKVSTLKHARSQCSRCWLLDKKPTELGRKLGMSKCQRDHFPGT